MTGKKKKKKHELVGIACKLVDDQTTIQYCSQIGGGWVSIVGVFDLLLLLSSMLLLLLNVN